MLINHLALIYHLSSEVRVNRPKIVQRWSISVFVAFCRSCLTNYNRNTFNFVAITEILSLIFEPT